MPLAVTHVLIPIILIDFIRDHYVKHKKAWPLKFILAAGIGGLLPDLDIMVGWLAYLLFGTDHWAFHRTLTHSIFFPLVFAILAVFFYFYKGGHNSYFKYSFMLSLGIASHLLLDMISGTVPLFFGMSSAAYGLNIGLESVLRSSILTGFDAILLILWLVHEEWHHKISDYI